MSFNQTDHKTTVGSLFCWFSRLKAPYNTLCPGLAVEHPKSGFAGCVLKGVSRLVGTRIRGFIFPTLRNDPAKPIFLNVFSYLACSGRRKNVSLAEKPNEISYLATEISKLFSLRISATYCQTLEFINKISYLASQRLLANAGKIHYVPLR